MKQPALDQAAQSTMPAKPLRRGFVLLKKSTRLVGRVVLALAVLCFVAGLLWSWQDEWYCNTSSSLPVGLYRVTWLPDVNSATFAFAHTTQPEVKSGTTTTITITTTTTTTTNNNNNTTNFSPDSNSQHQQQAATQIESRKILPSIERGSLVLACLEPELAAWAWERGYLSGHGKCTQGLAPIGKYVVAVAGDLVVSTRAGIKVNGKLQPNSKASRRDGAGRAMPQAHLNQVLKQGELLLLNPVVDSFDSRYWGLLRVEQVVGTLEPVLTWD